MNSNDNGSRRILLLALCVSVALAGRVAADIVPIKPAEERRANAAAAEKRAAEAAAAAEAAKIAAAKEAEETKRIAKDIAAAQERAQKSMRGSRVTLKGEMSLSDALAALEEQTENRLVDYRGRLDQERTDPTLKLELDDVSYWAAVEEVLAQAELSLYSYTNIPNTLGLAARPPGINTNPPISTTDLFRVQVTRLNATRDLRDEDAESMTASVEVTWEPRISPLVIHQKPGDVEAIGDDGEPLDLLSEYGVGDGRVQEGIGAVEMDLPFRLPPRSVQKIATLRGTLTAQIPAEHKKFTFTELENAKDIIKRDASVSVVLEKINKNRELHEFRVLLRLERAAKELKMQQGWIYSNAAYLVTPNGKRVDYAGLEMFRSTPDEIGLSYKFEAKDGLKDHQFIYESPSNIVTVPVKYEIKGIDLP